MAPEYPTKEFKDASPRQLNVGRCPYCKCYPTWFNDVPLAAFCWGSESNPHRQWKKRCTGVEQPYKS